MSFGFVDLFAGIGGFHQALQPLGGKLLLASEIDSKAREIYSSNFIKKNDNHKFAHDINDLTKNPRRFIPDHDILAGGFPCQPFSKSGNQKGINETRGTLFWNILKILEAKKPKILLLENVQNLIGPKHLRDWRIMVNSMRDLGYRVSDLPDVFSPHRLPPELGGTPQRRDRVFIVGIHVGKRRAWIESSQTPLTDSINELGWNPDTWNPMSFLQKDSSIENIEQYSLSKDELKSLSIWDDLHNKLRRSKNFHKFPGFPLWADFFTSRPRYQKNDPIWKRDFIKKNSTFYLEFKPIIQEWLIKNDYLSDLLPSHRKFEWQAKNSASLWDCLIQFRPSGIRVKNLNYFPTFVAIGQTSIIGPLNRRITEIECARLQGFEESFSFGNQNIKSSYKQIGNAVAVPAVQFILYCHVLKFRDDLPESITTPILKNYENFARKRGFSISKLRRIVETDKQLELIDLGEAI
jgi:DNA (cytosine-5)-methyltransferase 1